MSDRTEITVPAKVLGLIPLAISKIEGDRPVMLSFRLGRVVKPAQELQEAFVQRLRPFIDPVSPDRLRADLTEEEREQVEEILGEEITFEVPVIGLPELEEAGLTVPDETVLTFLHDIGVLSL